VIIPRIGTCPQPHTLRSEDSASRRQERPGYVLLAVLIVVVVLTLAAYQFTELMTSEQAAAQRATEAAQARAFAVSGLHFTAAVLADAEAFQTRLAGNPYDNPDAFRNIVVHAADTPRKEGRFAIVAAINQGDSTSPSYQTRYGVIDEGGKININAFIQFDSTGQRLHDALMQLPNMTLDLADAIVDWVDADDDTRSSGAESSYYGSLSPAYKAKNGPLNSLDELLLVKGMTVSMLYGTDRNRNGVADDGASELHGGLAEYLTVWGRELNTDASGDPRVYVNGTDDMHLLYEDLILAVGQEMADYVMAYRLYGGSSTTSGTTSGNRSSSRLPSGRTYVQTQQPAGGGGRGGTSGGGTGGGNTGGGSSASPPAPPTGGNSGSAPQGGTGGSSNPGTGQATGGNTSRGGNSKSGSTQPSSSKTTPAAAPKTVIGTPQDLQAAVQTSLAEQNVKAKVKLSSLARLINTQVTLPKANNAPANAPTIVVPSPLNDQSKRDQYLPVLMDKLSTQGNFELSPRINVNTASRSVLMALTKLSVPNSSRTATTSRSTQSTGTTATTTSPDTLTEADVDAILTARSGLSPADSTLSSPAWLLTLAGIKPTVYQRIERYITTRSSVYRVQSVGYFGEGGPVARVEAVIDTNQGSPRFLSFRDLTDLDTPRGFDPRQ